MSSRGIRKVATRGEGSKGNEKEKGSEPFGFSRFDPFKWSTSLTIGLSDSHSIRNENSFLH